MTLPSQSLLFESDHRKNLNVLILQAETQRRVHADTETQPLRCHTGYAHRPHGLGPQENHRPAVRKEYHLLGQDRREAQAKRTALV